MMCKEERRLVIVDAGMSEVASVTVSPAPY
jgi:hypothetical protein